MAEGNTARQFGFEELEGGHSVSEYASMPDNEPLEPGDPARLEQMFSDEEPAAENSQPASDLDSGEKKPARTRGEITFHKHPVFLASVFSILGVAAGIQFASKPSPTDEKTVPVIATKPGADLAGAKTMIENPFRQLKLMDELDPWSPLAGGLPLPPDSVPLVASGGDISISGPTATGGPVGTISPGGPAPGGGLKGDVTISGPIIKGPSTLPSGNTTLPNVSNSAGTKLPPAGSGNSSKVVPNTGAGQVKKEPDAPVVTKVGSHYLSVMVIGGDGESLQTKAASIGAALGGSAKKFTHVNEEAAVENYGALLIVPSENYAKAKSQIIAMSGANVEEESDGRPSERQGSIQGMFIARLDKLREKRKELLLDYTEDAPIIKQIDEAIEAESAAVAACRLPSTANISVIRVLFK